MTPKLSLPLQSAPLAGMPLQAKAARRLSLLQRTVLASLALHLALLLSPHLTDDAVTDTPAVEPPPLELVLVNAASADAPRAPQALAQANLLGGGDQPQAALASAAALGASEPSWDESLEESERALDALQRQQQHWLAQTRLDLAALTDHRDDSENTDDRIDATDSAAQQRMLLRQHIAQIEQRIALHNATPQRFLVGPSTRAVPYARYYDQLRRQIEARGTRDFPSVNGQRLYGELTLAMTVAASGELLDAYVTQPSGNPLLDRRALAIVRTLAPYATFSPQMREHARQIVLVAHFRFANQALQARVGPTAAAPAGAP